MMSSWHDILAISPAVYWKITGWVIIEELFYATWSFVHHLVTIGELKLELQSGTPNLGQNQQFL